MIARVVFVMVEVCCRLSSESIEKSLCRGNRVIFVMFDGYVSRSEGVFGKECNRFTLVLQSTLLPRQGSDCSKIR